MLSSVQWYVSTVIGYVCGYQHKRIVIIQYQGGRKEGTFPSMQNWCKKCFQTWMLKERERTKQRES